MLVIYNTTLTLSAHKQNIETIQHYEIQWNTYIAAIWNSEKHHLLNQLSPTLPRHAYMWWHSVNLSVKINIASADLFYNFNL